MFKSWMCDFNGCDNCKAMPVWCHKFESPNDCDGTLCTQSCSEFSVLSVCLLAIQCILDLFWLCSFSLGIQNHYLQKTSLIQQIPYSSSLVEMTNQLSESRLNPLLCKFNLFHSISQFTGQALTFNPNQAIWTPPPPSRTSLPHWAVRHRGCTETGHFNWNLWHHSFSVRAGPLIFHEKCS